MARTKGTPDANGKVDFTPKGRPVVHGRASSYNNQGCRCQDCKDAWAKYMHPRLKSWRATQKKKKKAGTRVKI
jgi:hypothetical protein